MSINNIERLKKKFNCYREDDTTDKYLRLIDLVYYEEKEFKEDYNVEEDTIKFIFSEEEIEMDMEDIRNVMLFIMDLSNDADEQLGYDFKSKLKKSHYIFQG